ncbi:MAG: phosphate acyltransferase, partial [Pseudomonadota bacterium]
RVLRAAEIVLEDRMGQPILIGRRRVVEARAARAGLKRVPHEVEVIDPEDDPRYRDYVDTYFSLVGRRGVTPEAARTAVRTNTTVIGALAVHMGDADTMICGAEGGYQNHVDAVTNVIGLMPGVREPSALSLLLRDRDPIFLVDTQISHNPNGQDVAEMALLAAEHIRTFGITPRAALLSASRFGSRDIPSATLMREALEMLNRLAPELEVDGEMSGEEAMVEAVRARIMPDSPLTGTANLLVFPNIDAAHIAMTLIQAVTDALHVGPILLGLRQSVHITSQSATARGILNLSAIAVADAAARRESLQAAG